MPEQSKSIRYWFYCDTLGPIGSGAVLILRLVVGAAFLFHGWPKIQNPMGWMGPQAPVPGVLQALAAVAEFGGGLAFILGLLTRLAALGIISTMLVALATVHLPRGDPFVAKSGPSYELPAVYLACAVVFLVLGPGKIGIDALIFGEAKEKG